MTDEVATEGVEGRMSLLEHLGELRNRIIKAVIAVAIGATIGWIIYPWVLDFLTEPLEQIDDNLALTDGKLLLDRPAGGLLPADQDLGLHRHRPGHAGDPLAAVAVHRARALPERAALRRRRSSASATVLFVFGAAIAY